MSVALPRAASAGDSGERDFPATLVVQEPQVETEIAPQIARFGNGDARQTDLSTELSLQLAAPLSVFVSPDYTILRPGGSGFQALEVGFKYQFVTDAAHEIVVSAGVSSELGGIGSPLVDADTFTTIIPTLYFGKLTLGLEALIPINRESGTHPGARLQASYSFNTPFARAEDQPH